MADRRRADSAAVADVAENLMSEFEGHLSLKVISNEVLRADRQLGGQVPSDAMPELLHRLARQRLLAVASS